MTFETPEEMARLLVLGGWREYPNVFKRDARCFYKRFATPARCHCNDDKDGMQVEAALYSRDGAGGIELELCGMLKHGPWLRIQHYALPNKVEGALAAIPAMLRAWEAANNELS